jgi:hypothetical protein
MKMSCDGVMLMVEPGIDTKMISILRRMNEVRLLVANGMEHQPQLDLSALRNEVLEMPKMFDNVPPKKAGYDRVIFELRQKGIVK